MIEWIAEHPTGVILLCELLALVVFLVFIGSLALISHRKGEARMEKDDEEHKKTMASFQKTNQYLNEASKKLEVEIDNEVVLRRLH